jgi:hypothetical protein
MSHPLPVFGGVDEVPRAIDLGGLLGVLDVLHKT